MDVHSKIVEAAIERIATAGYEGLSISSVARHAGLSRPTVYAHFGTLEQLAAAALEAAAVRVTSRIVERARAAASAADYVVEVIVAARAEFRNEPALSPIAFPQRGTPLFDGDPIGPYALQLTRSFLTPLLEFEPRLEPDLDEIAETMLRLLISLVMFESTTSRSDDTLRGYLHRRLVPSIIVTS